MSYPGSLLDVARRALQVDTLGKGRPAQAVLRRAVSTAYYAIFHFVGDGAARQMLGSSPNPVAVARRRILVRALSHDQMAAFCRSVSGGTLSRLFDGPSQAPCFTPCSRLRSFAETLARAKEMRQRADYDLNRPLTLAEARGIVSDVEAAIGSWQDIAAPDCAMFLMCALLWPQLKDRRSDR